MREGEREREQVWIIGKQKNLSKEIGEVNPQDASV